MPVLNETISTTEIKLNLTALQFPRFIAPKLVLSVIVFLPEVFVPFFTVNFKNTFYCVELYV